MQRPGAARHHDRAVSIKTIEVRESRSGRSAYVGQTRVRVSDIARMYETLQMEFITERIREAIPHLTEDEIVAALQYWKSHRQEIDSEIERDEEVLDSLKSAM